MKWVLVVAFALAVFAALVVVTGLALPKGHRAACSARYRRPPAEVWAVIADFGAGASWRADLKSVERGPDRNGHPVWIEVGRNGRIPLEIEEADRGRRIVTRIADDSLPFGGTWTFELRGTDGGTTLTITEDGEIRNAVFRTMARFVFGYHATMEGYLEALGRRLGETVAPARVEPAPSAA
ncbi:MAG TPA: SRPBCC family protein [Verrucomicrobiae bacterium]|nr:SRPBCC family protein [Verrucomicrobiae bacterium]